LSVLSLTVILKAVREEARDGKLKEVNFGQNTETASAYSSSRLQTGPTAIEPASPQGLPLSGEWAEPFSLTTLSLRVDPFPYP
jgi:hypothetical protein